MIPLRLHACHRDLPELALPIDLVPAHPSQLGIAREQIRGEQDCRPNDEIALATGTDAPHHLPNCAWLDDARELAAAALDHCVDGHGGPIVSDQSSCSGIPKDL